MPLTENQMRFTAAAACLSKVSVITGHEKLFYASRVYIYDEKLGKDLMHNCNGFKVRITKYQLKKQIGLVLS